MLLENNQQNSVADCENLSLFFINSEHENLLQENTKLITVEHKNFITNPYPCLSFLEMKKGA
jgi:hypothetical protein